MTVDTSIIDASNIKDGDHIKVEYRYHADLTLMEGTARRTTNRDSIYLGQFMVWSPSLLAASAQKAMTIIEHTPVWHAPEGWQDWDGVAIMRNTRGMIPLLVVRQSTADGARWSDGYVGLLDAAGFEKQFADHEWGRITLTTWPAQPSADRTAS